MKSKAVLFLGLFLISVKAESSVLFVALSSITVPDSPLLDNTTNFTLSVWIKPTASGGAYVILGKRRGVPDNVSYMLFINATNNVVFDTGGPPSGGVINRLTSTLTITTTTWNHIAAVFDGSLSSTERMKIYINGVLDSATIAGPAYITDTLSNLVIASAGATTATYQGYIDDVRIYIHRSFTQNEVTNLYRSRSRVFDTDSLAFYAPLNTGQDGTSVSIISLPGLDIGPNRLGGYGGSTLSTWSSISPLSIPGGDQ